MEGNRLDRVQKRFDELAEQAEAIAASMKTEPTQVPSLVQNIYESRKRMVPGTKYLIATDDLDIWTTSAKSHLFQVFGESHPVYETFNGCFTGRQNIHEWFKSFRNVFESAKEQYEGGYLFDVQNLVHAEVFSNELEQAEHFLRNKHDVAAAVTAGVVLETTIKKICQQQTPPIDLLGSNGTGKKTDTLISDLKNGGAYNEAVAKQLRAWMNVRNDAAHGTRKDGEFDDGEIRRMIDGVGDFVVKHMA